MYFTLNSEDALHTVLEVKGSGFDVASLSDNFVLRKYAVFHGVFPLGEGFLPSPVKHDGLAVDPDCRRNMPQPC